MAEIIVIGGNHHNTLGVIRSLGFKDLRCTLLLVSNAIHPYISYSRYINVCVQVKTERDAISFLIKNKNNFKEKSVVIACSDAVASALDLNQDSLLDKYYLPGIQNRGSLTHFMNKDVMSRMGESVGFNIPTSWIVEDENDISNIEYPCITKPILSKDGRKSDIKVCHSKEELLLMIREGSCHSYQVQTYIDKEFEYQLIGLSLNKGEELIIPGLSHCIRPCPGTNTGFLRYESLDGFHAPIELCNNFVKKLGYSGLFSIEFIRGKDGIDYFLEMNYRNDGNSICVTKSGTNLPYIWYLYCIGEDYKKELEQSSLHEVYVMPEFDDFRFVLRHELSLWKWLKEVRRTDAFMEYDSSDKKPFITLLAQFLKRGVRKIKRA